MLSSENRDINQELSSNVLPRHDKYTAVLDQIICPVTLQIFMYPMQLDCGNDHYVEGDVTSKILSIDSFCKPTCPCCRKNITQAALSRQLKNTIDAYLQEHPELKKQQYQSENHFLLGATIKLPHQILVDASIQPFPPPPPPEPVQSPHPSRNRIHEDVIFPHWNTLFIRRNTDAIQGSNHHEEEKSTRCCTIF